MKSPSASKHRRARAKLFWLINKCNMRPISQCIIGRNLSSRKKGEKIEEVGEKIVRKKILTIII